MDNTDDLTAALTRLSEALYAVQSWLDDEEPATAYKWRTEILDVVERFVITDPILGDNADPALYDLEV